MFDNIGGKIKGLAKVLCGLGILASVIAAIVIWNGANRYGYSYDGAMIGAGFAVLVVGTLLSWIGSFVLYGFGQLVENSDMAVQGIRQMQRGPVQSAPHTPNEDLQSYAAAVPSAAPSLYAEPIASSGTGESTVSVDSPQPDSPNEAYLLPGEQAGMAICSKCSKDQRDNRSVCFSCGAIFVSRDK